MTKNAVLELTFAAGIDESHRSELLDPRGGFVTLENVRQNRRGGITKRSGFSALTLARLDATNRAAGYKLFAHGEQACVVDGHHLDAYSTATGTWVTRDRVPEPACTFRGLPSIHASTYTDVLHCNGYIVAATVQTTPGAATKELVVSVVDATTYEIIASTLVESGFTPGWTSVKLGSVGDEIVVFYAQALHTLKARTLDLASAATISSGWSAATSLAVDLHADSVFDVCSMSDRIAVAYVNTSVGTSRATVLTVSAARATLETATVNTSSTTPVSIACAGSIADTLWIGWDEGISVKVKGLSGASLATVLATTATVSGFVAGAAYVSGIAVTGAGTGVAVAFNPTSYSTNVAAFITAAGAATAWGNHARYYIGYCSRPWAVDGRVYVAASHIDPTYFALLQSDGDWTRFVIDVTDIPSTTTGTLRAVANMTPGLAYSEGWVVFPVPPHVVELSATKVGLFHRTIQRRASAGTVDTSAGIEELDFAATARWQTARHAGVTVLSGGVTSYYDGESVAECGFLVRPNKPTETHASGSGLTPVVGYRYIAIYEHVDASGEVHVSGASDPSALTGAFANKAVTVTVSNLNLTSRYDTASSAPPATSSGSCTRVALYRTTDGGTVYYRVSSSANVVSAATLTFVDAMSDASLAAQPKLCRQPGTLGTGQDRRAPPSSRLVAVYNEMIVVTADMPGTLWHSAAKVYGEGAWFSPIWQLQIAGAEEITGLAVQDGTLFVFSRLGIWAVNGEPPSDNGAAGGLGTPRRLAVDVGCIDARSIVVTSLGVFFQSARGIEILTRAQSVDWIGQPIQDTLDAFPVCASATHSAAAGLVLFELASSEAAHQVSGTGRTAVFDLTIRRPDGGVGTWVSTDRRTDEAATPDAPAQDGAIVYDGSAWRYAWLGTDARVYLEDDSASLDPGGTWVTMKASTPWVHVAGMQGEQILHSALLLAERHTNHDLSVSVYRDYVDSSPDTTVMAADVLAALPRQWIERPLTTRKGTAVRVVLSDVTPSVGTVDAGKGATWVALTFTGEAHAGVTRTSTGQRG